MSVFVSGVRGCWNNVAAHTDAAAEAGVLFERVLQRLGLLV